MRGLSQSELARRVGVRQPTIFKVVSGSSSQSKHLHRIARELGTTPAYLSGETDDPGQDHPDSAILTHKQRELIETFDHLDAVDQMALLHVARSMAGKNNSGSVHSPKRDFGHKAPEE